MSAMATLLAIFLARFTKVRETLPGNALMRFKIVRAHVIASALMPEVSPALSSILPLDISTTKGIRV